MPSSSPHVVGYDGERAPGDAGELRRRGLVGTPPPVVVGIGDGSTLGAMLGIADWVGTKLGAFETEGAMLGVVPIIPPLLLPPLLLPPLLLILPDTTAISDKAM